MEVYYCWTRPWAQCELCYFGPGVLNEGSHFLFTINLFLVEFGVRIRRRE